MYAVREGELDQGRGVIYDSDSDDDDIVRPSHNKTLAITKVLLVLHQLELQYHS